MSAPYFSTSLLLLIEIHRLIDKSFSDITLPMTVLLFCKPDCWIGLWLNSLTTLRNKVKYKSEVKHKTMLTIGTDVINFSYVFILSLK